MGEVPFGSISRTFSKDTNFFFFTNGKLLVTCFPQAGILLESSQLASQLSYFQRQKTDAPIQLHDVIQDELLASMCGFQRLEAVNMSIMCAGKKNRASVVILCLHCFFQSTDPAFSRRAPGTSPFLQTRKSWKSKGKSARKLAMCFDAAVFHVISSSEVQSILMFRWPKV